MSHIEGPRLHRHHHRPLYGRFLQHSDSMGHLLSHALVQHGSALENVQQRLEHGLLFSFKRIPKHALRGELYRPGAQLSSLSTQTG